MRRLARRVLKRPAPGRLPLLEAEHLSVLDGRTLNVCVRLPAEAAARGQRVWLCTGGGERELAVVGSRGEGAFVLTEAGAADPGQAPEPQVPTCTLPELPLTGHRHQPLSVRIGKTSYAIAPPPTEPRADGPTRPDPPRSDGRHVTVIERAGAVALACRTLPPTAHVEGIDVGWLRLTVTGRLVGAAAPAHGAVAELVPRDGGPPVPLTGLGWNGTAFTLTVTAAELAPAVRTPEPASPGRPAAPAAPAPRTFDIRLHLPPHPKPLRLARALTDITVPKSVHRLPTRVLRDPGRSAASVAIRIEPCSTPTAIRIQPYFTPTGRLALTLEAIACGSLS